MARTNGGSHFGRLRSVRRENHPRLGKTPSQALAAAGFPDLPLRPESVPAATGELVRTGGLGVNDRFRGRKGAARSASKDSRFPLGSPGLEPGLQRRITRAERARPALGAAGQALRLLRKGMLLLSLLLVAGGGVLQAQSSDTGAIAGRIADPSGALVPNVAVTVVNEETGVTRVVKSNAVGRYRAPLLPPGLYTVRLAAPGFAKASLRSVRVVVTDTTVADLLLQLATTSTKVSVSTTSAYAPAEASALGRMVAGSTITGLPLSNRNFTQILALSPGVVVELPDAGALGRNTQNVAANGANTTDNNFEFNGIDANNIAENSASGYGPEVGVAVPAPDTIAEFKVQTGLYDAAYGRSSGANVDLVSRAGTNGFHATLWEFFRNDALNANGFFLNQSGQPRPVLKQNQFGFTFGGPVRKDHTFFFLSYQGTVQRNGQSSLSEQSAFLPPLTNDRSAAALGRLFGGQSGALGGAAIAPDGSNINPAALALLNFKFPNGQYAIPSPQLILPNGLGESTFSSPAKFREDQMSLNLDHAFSSQNQGAARFFYSKDLESSPFGQYGANLPGWGIDESDQNAMLVLSDTYTFSPSLVNVARFGYVRFHGAQASENPIPASAVGITTPTGLPQIPEIDINGLFMIGDHGGPFFDEATNNFVGKDSLSYLFGGHNLQAGFEAKRTQLNVNSPFVTDGFTFFLSFPDFLLGESGNQNGSGVSNVFSSSASAGSFYKAERYTDLAGYVLDDFKVTPRLSLNAGLRYEFFGPPSDIFGQMPNFDPALADPNPPAAGTNTGLVLASNYHGPLPGGVTKTAGSGLWNKDFTDFAPRVGFALDLRNRPDLVLRGGYGIYYQRLTGQLALDTIGALPFSISIYSAGASNSNASLQIPFSPPLPPLSSFPIFQPRYADSSLFFPAIARSLRSPYLQEYSLSLEAEPGRNLLWQIGYVGSHGDRLTGCVEFNQAELATPAHPVHGQTTNSIENVAQRVPILGVGGGSFICQTAFHSNYNSLQTSLTRQFGGGLTFLASYTWAKLLNETGGGGPFDLNFITNDQTQPGNGYGPAAFDRTHRFVVSFVEQPPPLRRGPRLAQQALSRWRFSGILVLQSGLPITPVDSTAGTIYGNAVSASRAECTGANPASSGSVEGRLNGFFNPAAFAPAPAIGDGTGFGNCGTGILRGPAQGNLDLGIQRAFPIAESNKVEFRAEFFNLFNTPNFGMPVTDFSSPSFGVISSTASNPRIVQLALKYDF